MSRTPSERLMYVQFTPSVYGVLCFITTFRGFIDLNFNILFSLFYPFVSLFFIISLIFIRQLLPKRFPGFNVNLNFYVELPTLKQFLVISDEFFRGASFLTWLRKVLVQRYRSFGQNRLYFSVCKKFFFNNLFIITAGLNISTGHQTIPGNRNKLSYARRKLFTTGTVVRGEVKNTFCKVSTFSKHSKHILFFMVV